MSSTTHFSGYRVYQAYTSLQELVERNIEVDQAVLQKAPPQSEATVSDLASHVGNFAVVGFDRLVAVSATHFRPKKGVDSAAGLDFFLAAQ